MVGDLMLKKPLSVPNSNGRILWEQAPTAHEYLLDLWNKRWNQNNSFNLVDEAEPDNTNFPFIPKRKFEAHTLLQHLSPEYLVNPIFTIPPIFELAFFNLTDKPTAQFIHQTMERLIDISSSDLHKKALSKYLCVSLDFSEEKTPSGLGFKDALELMSLAEFLAGKQITIDLTVAAAVKSAILYEIELARKFGSFDFFGL